MRSIRTLSAVTGLLVLASACGDGGGTPPPDNEAPVANFALPVPPCTINVACNFIDASTDDVLVTGWRWTFGDGGEATTEDAAHMYTAAGTYTVTLTVTDGEGLQNTKSASITIAPLPPVNTPPTAGFTTSCTEATCTFINTSSDVAPGTIVTNAWTFGDNTTSDQRDPAPHTYTITAPTTFTVTLTVTDNEGAIDVETQTVNVTPPPPATQDCSTSGFVVNCTLDITARSTVRITLSSVSCELAGNNINIPPPIGDNVFFNVCTGNQVGESRPIAGGPTDAAIVFEAGSQVTIRFVQGTDDPAPGAPAAHFGGTFPNWTISIDDGGNQGGAGEPNFTDVVLAVQATAAR